MNLRLIWESRHEEGNQNNSGHVNEWSVLEHPEELQIEQIIVYWLKFHHVRNQKSVSKILEYKAYHRHCENRRHCKPVEEANCYKDENQRVLSF